MRSVYVAGSSSEIERAEKWIAKLRAAGVNVTSTWTENIRKVGDANPREATAGQRESWAVACIDEVGRSSVLWLLAPTSPTFGAGFECGHFDLLRETGAGAAELMVASGNTKASIFIALGEEYATDEEAFARVVEVCR